MRRISGSFALFLALVPALVGFDLGTKRAVEQTMDVGQEISLIDGWLSLFYVHNPHVAFSVPIPLPAIVFGAAVALVALVAMAYKLRPDAWVQTVALASIAGGALGNLLDRWGDGAVTDFVRVYTEQPELRSQLVDWFGTATWPIFNVADMLVLGGVALWVLHETFAEPDDEAGEALEPG